MHIKISAEILRQLLSFSAGQSQTLVRPVIDIKLVTDGFLITGIGCKARQCQPQAVRKVGWVCAVIRTRLLTVGYRGNIGSGNNHRPHSTSTVKVEDC